MTDREIKLELTKIAMPCGMPIETAKKYYEWIMEEPEREVVDKPTKWDDTPIEELAYKTRIEGTIIKRCKDNGINTVGDLIRCGAHKFLTFKLVGKGTITQIDNALEDHFGISDWYTT
jgi:DNA-directed RNA polymerase alpha subunit